MIGNKNPLQQSIHDKVVEPRGRGQLLPDSGIAVKSTGTNLAVQYGLSNPSVQNLFQGLASAISTFVSWFNPVGLRTQEIYVDITARTPQGRVNIYNVLLNTNGLEDSGAKIQDALNNGKELDVKITWDGGRAMECSPVSLRLFNPPTGSVVAQQQALGTPGSGPSPMSGADTTTNSTTANPLGSMVALPPGAVVPGLQFYPGSYTNFVPIASMINQTAALFGMPATLIGAFILKESSGIPSAFKYDPVHPADHSCGLMQVTWNTFPDAVGYAKNKVPDIANYATTPTDMYKPQISLILGTAYLTYYCLVQGNGNWQTALRIYNGGTGFQNSADAILYESQVSANWAMFNQIAQRATQALIQNTGEYNKQDHTNVTAQSGHSAVGGA